VLQAADLWEGDDLAEPAWRDHLAMVDLPTLLNAVNPKERSALTHKLVRALRSRFSSGGLIERALRHPGKQRLRIVRDAAAINRL
jgi:hypothetical protein